MRIPSSLAAAVALGAALPSPAQEIKVRAALIAAKEAAAADPEGAAGLLREAWGKAQNMPSSSKQRSTFEAEVDRLLRDLDPNAGRLMKARNKAADELARVVPKYANAGWKRTTLEIVDLIRALDPDVLRPEVDDVVAKLTPGEAAVSTSSSESPVIMEWFREAKTMFRETPWMFSPDTIGSPPFSAAEWGLRPSALLVSSRTLAGDARVRVEILTGELGKAAFCWNLPTRGQGRKPYYIVNIEDVERGKILHFGIMKDSGWEKLAESVALDMDPHKRHDWVPVAIELRAETIAVKAGAMEKAIEVAADFDTNGHPALLVPGDTHNRSGAHFRGLVIERL